MYHVDNNFQTLTVYSYELLIYKVICCWVDKLWLVRCLWFADGMVFEAGRMFAVGRMLFVVHY